MITLLVSLIFYFKEVYRGMQNDIEQFISLSKARPPRQEKLQSQ